ncbi:hypothetical protein ACO0LM_23765 [Undibacterium sp. Di26W]|uniref:hypothetical protein n=1 Tax=Undibacterium sp. Di26W TaxID=3413035 RepID=UPI003BEFFBF5
MICFEITINGKFLCRAGVENATVISPGISMFADAGKAAHLRLSALTVQADGRRTHVSWFDEIELSPGDDVSFIMLESNAPTEPVKVTLLALEDYTEMLALPEGFENTQPPQVLRTEAEWSVAALLCSINGEQKTLISAMPGDEDISCSLVWSNKKPDCYRIFTGSFGDDSASSHERKWLRSVVSIHDTLTLRIIA